MSDPRADQVHIYLSSCCPENPKNISGLAWLADRISICRTGWPIRDLLWVRGIPSPLLLRDSLIPEHVDETFSDLSQSDTDILDETIARYGHLPIPEIYGQVQILMRRSEWDSEVLSLLTMLQDCEIPDAQGQYDEILSLHHANSIISSLRE